MSRSYFTDILYVYRAGEDRWSQTVRFGGLLSKNEINALRGANITPEDVGLEPLYPFLSQPRLFGPQFDRKHHVIEDIRCRRLSERALRRSRVPMDDRSIQEMQADIRWSHREGLDLRPLHHRLVYPWDLAHRVIRDDVASLREAVVADSNVLSMMVGGESEEPLLVCRSTLLAAAVRADAVNCTEFLLERKAGFERSDSPPPFETTMNDMMSYAQTHNSHRVARLLEPWLSAERLESVGPAASSPPTGSLSL